MIKTPKGCRLAILVFSSALASFTAHAGSAAEAGEMFPGETHGSMDPSHMDPMLMQDGLTSMDHMAMGGVMGLGPVWMLDLQGEQRKKINNIQDELRRQNWATMGKIMDLQAKMRDLYLEKSPDPKAIGNLYSQISELRRQMVERNVVAMNQVRALLTEEQLAQLKTLRRNMWMRHSSMNGPIHQGSVGRHEP